MWGLCAHINLLALIDEYGGNSLTKMLRSEMSKESQINIFLIQSKKTEWFI